MHAPPPTETDRPDPLSAEERARFAAMSPADLAGRYNERFLADELAAAVLAQDRARTQAIGSLLRDRMLAAGLVSVEVAHRRTRVRLDIQRDCRGFHRTRIDRSSAAGENPP